MFKKSFPQIFAQNRYKNILLTISLLLFLFSLINNNLVKSEDVFKEGFGTYAKIDSVKKEVMLLAVDNTNNVSGKIIIPQIVVHNGKNYQVTQIGSAIEPDIEAIIYTTDVTVMPKSIFTDPNTVSSVILPPSIKTIGYGAFTHCQNLTTIILNQGLTSILRCAFFDCPNLCSVILPDSLQTIEFAAFEGTGINELIFPENLQNLEGGTFKNSYNLMFVKLPKKITIIKEKMFENSTKLLNADLPDSIEIIEEGAFFNSGLTEITIPKSICNFKRAFGACYQLNQINFPNSLKTINYAAFFNCSHLESIVFPQNLIEIEPLAFASCSNLETIVFPKTLKIIGKRAFFSCINLKVLNLPGSLTKVDTKAFKRCTALVSIILANESTIPTYFGARVFDSCQQLKAVTFYKPVKISKNTFYACPFWFIFQS